MKSVGIDIGSYSVKVAEVEDTSRGYTLRDYSEIPLGNDPSQDQRILLIDALRKVAAHYQNRQVRFVFGIDQEKVATRLKTFPFKERHQILKSLPFQLSDDVPFDPFSAVFDARFLATRGSFTDIMALICPKDHVKECIETANDGGMDPEIVTAQSVGLSNFFIDFKEPPTEIQAPLFYDGIDLSDMEDTEPRLATVLLDIGHTKTEVMVFLGSNMMAIRTLDFGGLTIAKLISQKYEIPEVDGLKNLVEKGFILTTEEGASKDQIFFSDTIKSAIASMTGNLQRTLISLSSSLNLQFQQIHLIGGVSRLTNIGPFLTQELEVPCNPYRIVNSIPDSDISLNDHQITTSANAIGLAMEGLRRPRNPAVNFRKAELAIQSESLEAFWSTYRNTIRIGVAMVLLLFVYGITRSYFAEALAEKGDEALRGQASGIGIRLPSEVKVKRYIRSKKREISAQKEITKLAKLNSSLDVLKEISRTFPSKNSSIVDVKRFSVKNALVTLEGEVSRRDDLNLVQNTLRALSGNGKVNIAKPTFRASSGKIAFSYQLNVKRIE